MFCHSRQLPLILVVVGVSVALSLGGCNPGEQGFVDNGFDVCGGFAQEGCSCTPGHVVACFPDTPLVDENGESYCIEGHRECSAAGTWGACVFPQDAVHHEIIGDPELCGGCDPACWTVHDCPTGRDLDEGNTDYVRFDLDADGLVLGGSIYSTRYAYVANNPASTVSKINLDDGTEVGRYLVGLQDNGTDNAPSRTAIDSRGNAYVASRAFDLYGSVTKIAGDSSYCYDRNMNGVIETSTGGADVRPWNDDECILWTVQVGSLDAVPRALAVDANDNIWVGLFFDEQFVVLDHNDGSVITTVDVDGSPYGAAIGRDGLLWYPDYCCDNRWIQSINTETYEVGPQITRPSGICDGSYGIAVDTQGRVLVGGYPESCVSRYDPITESWEAFWTTSGYVRGVTIDFHGNIWAASHLWGSSGPHWLTRWDDTGATVDVYTLEDDSGTMCGIPIGVGADFSGRVWAPCQNNSRIARVDPDTGTVNVFDTGANPYTYSDFTGFLRSTVTAPEGSYLRLYDSRLACSGSRSTLWSQLHWDVETPTNTEISFIARTADSVEHLGLSPEMVVATVPGNTSPINLRDAMSSYGVANTLRYLEIRVVLRAFVDDTTPVFRNMDAVFFCMCDCDIDYECSDDCDCDEDCV